MLPPSGKRETPSPSEVGETHKSQKNPSHRTHRGYKSRTNFKKEETLLWNCLHTVKKPRGSDFPEGFFTGTSAFKSPRPLEGITVDLLPYKLTWVESFACCSVGRKRVCRISQVNEKRTWWLLGTDEKKDFIVAMRRVKPEAWQRPEQGEEMVH